MTADKAQDAGTLGVVIVAAGRGLRMHGVDKIFALINGMPVIAYSLRTFAAIPQVSRIALVLSEDRVRDARRMATAFGMGKVAATCAGGERRRDSVRAGLEALGACDWVAVHDGARPLVDSETVTRGLKAAAETGAAVSAVPAKDTIKVVSDDGSVRETPPRESLWQVQTPQIFRYDTLMRAHEECNGDFTDDASMIESLGSPVKVFMGSYRNVKVTTPEDLAVVEALVNASGRGAIS